MALTDQELVERVMEEEGFDDSLELMEHCIYESVVPSICTECGTVGSGCEPDARKYRCESCGEMTRNSVMEHMPL
jgi:hypothetical protein